jgi:predicted unusual protein kinase regulating ubiquinone biosynthesis (AarF/ABC1/UbiB family)
MMEKSLGVSWQEKFKSFKHEPFASASIGQVHKALLPNEKVNVVNNFR